MAFVHQHTIRNPIHCIGFGQRSGFKTALKFLPAPPDSGIVFCRIFENADHAIVNAHCHNVSDSAPSTTIANDDGVAV